MRNSIWPIIGWQRDGSLNAGVRLNAGIRREKIPRLGLVRKTGEAAMRGPLWFAPQILSIPYDENTLRILLMISYESWVITAPLCLRKRCIRMTQHIYAEYDIQNTRQYSNVFSLKLMLQFNWRIAILNLDNTKILRLKLKIRKTYRLWAEIRELY